MLTASSPAEQQQLEDNFFSLRRSRQAEAACLVLVVGGVNPVGKQLAVAYNQIHEGILALKEKAQTLNMPLALEPLHPMYTADRACLNSLKQANDWAAELDVGIDVYHLWWEAGLYTQIQRAKKRILAFHICDWLLNTEYLLLNRGMMGDGVIDLGGGFAKNIFKAGYAGFFEVEIFSAKNWWQKDPNQVLEICKQRHQQLLMAV